MRLAFAGGLQPRDMGDEARIEGLRDLKHTAQAWSTVPGANPSEDAGAKAVHEAVVALGPLDVLLPLL